jgi:DNA-3-methyladenine glycosylase II
VFDVRAAERQLARADPVMGRLVRELGPSTLKRARGMDTYQVLVRAVAHQQLHGVAAERILARLAALASSGPGFPAPEQLLALPEGALRKVGFSTAKALSLRDIAAKTIAGVVPNARALARLGEEEAIERLTAVRGIGRWTSEILLLRSGRPDVLPADDLGLRSGFRAAYGRGELPTPRELRAFGERWRPFRSVASWYLWRAAARERERARQAGVTARSPRSRAAARAP